ncbi:MAG: copper amine oxidase N-terminal domain-containing protein [Cellulosilyticaceae bacterium]
MKKIITMLLTILFLSLALTSTLLAEPVVINNKQVEIDTKVINNRKLAPLRQLCNELSASVKYDPKTNDITISNDKTIIKMNTAKNIAYINDNEVKLDARPTIINGTTYLPLRFISENLGYKLKSNNDFLEITSGNLIETNNTKKGDEYIKDNQYSDINIDKNKELAIQDYEILKNNIDIIDKYIINKSKEEIIQNMDNIDSNFNYVDWQDLKTGKAMSLLTYMNEFGRIKKYYIMAVKATGSDSEIFDNFDRKVKSYEKARDEFLALIK